MLKAEHLQTEEGGSVKNLILVFMVVLTGCASVASPSLIDNNYYMMGDSNCVRARFISATRIMCINNDGAETGYRDAMSTQDMQMYQTQQIVQQMQAQQLNQALQNVNQSLQQTNQQLMQQNQQFVAPQVQPINPQGSYGTTTYHYSGGTWFGSNGTSCRVVGQSILCSDGKRCQMVGQSLICN